MNRSSVNCLILLIFNLSMGCVATIRACCCFRKSSKVKLIDLNERRMSFLQNEVAYQACSRVSMDWVGKPRESILEKRKRLAAKK